ncbi:MAG: carbohydrate-binding domain-containing protein [bacterium]|nr:carbohydrate-binding domain-containing protein [bacterium]
MKLKKIIIPIMALAMTYTLFGCSKKDETSIITNSTTGNSVITTKTNSSSNTGDVTGDDVNGNTSNIEIDDDEITASFILKDSDDNVIEGVNGIYTISNAGSYVASGKLEDGQIYVDASDCEVEISFEGVSISNSSISPIFVNDASEVTLKIKKNTTNYIYDNRTTDYSESEDDTIGKAAIYASNGDLKFSGKGTISITSLNNSGIHGKDNVKIKNCTMLVKAMNNGIKGNDKVTIEEDPTIGIIAGNNGIRTSNSDLSSKGNQQGYIYINGGTITINSYGDGIDAAYAVEIGTSTDSDGITYTPTVDIYTNIYSSYTLTTSTVNSEIKLQNYYASPQIPGGGFDGGGFNGGQAAEKADESAKAIKANEYINVSAGNIFAYTYDDCLHTNDDTLDTGVKASANITISGGTLKLKASDDAIHADGALTIDDGEIYIAESHEGIEGNTININGGSTTVFANDDAVNASNAINVTGGLLDATVSPNGDTDGIDSNGTITISGGTIITRGPNQEMASPIDADGTLKITGGTVIIVGYYQTKISTNLTKTQSSSGSTSGSHTVTVGSTVISYKNSNSYNGTTTVLASQSASIK